MRNLLTALFLCFAILVGIVENASGASTVHGLKIASGDFWENPNICTYKLGSLELEPCRGDTIVGYDSATDVLYYVRQNPWSSFDPLGLDDKPSPWQQIKTWFSEKIDQLAEAAFHAYTQPQDQVIPAAVDSVVNSTIDSFAEGGLGIPGLGQDFVDATMGDLKSPMKNLGADYSEEARKGGEFVAVVEGLALATVTGFQGKTPRVQKKGAPKLGDPSSGSGPSNPQSPTSQTSGGRKGNAATRAQNQAIADRAEAAGEGTHTGGASLPERYYPPPGGGRKGGRYSDVEITRHDETKRVVNTVDTDRNGIPTDREIEAGLDIYERLEPGDTLELIPKAH